MSKLKEIIDVMCDIGPYIENEDIIYKTNNKRLLDDTINYIRREVKYQGNIDGGRQIYYQFHILFNHCVEPIVFKKFLLKHKEFLSKLEGNFDGYFCLHEDEDYAYYYINYNDDILRPILSIEKDTVNFNDSEKSMAVYLIDGYLEGLPFLSSYKEEERK